MLRVCTGETPLAEIADLKPTDSDNIARFPEGQNIPTINNGARALEGIIARYFSDTNGTIVSTGTQPNYAVATNRTIPALADGLVVVWRAHAAFASGTATLTINALAQKNLKRQDGTALVVGDIVANQTVVSRYNSATDAIECLGISGVVGDAATQTQMEAASSDAVAVTPGRQHYHPSAAKEWLKATVSGGTPTLQSPSYNITSVTDTAQGKLGITIATDHSSAHWAAIHSGGQYPSVDPANQTSGSIVIESVTQGVGATDPSVWYFTGFGDQ